MEVCPEMASRVHAPGAVIVNSQVGTTNSTLINCDSGSRDWILKAIAKRIPTMDVEDPSYGAICGLKTVIESKDEDAVRAFIARNTEAIVAGLASSALWSAICSYFGIG